MFENGYENTAHTGEGSTGSAGSFPWVDMSNPDEMRMYDPGLPRTIDGLSTNNDDSLYFGDIYGSQARYSDLSNFDSASTLSQVNLSSRQDAPVSGQSPSQAAVDRIAQEFASSFTSANSQSEESRAVQRLFDQAAAAHTDVHDMTRVINNALQEKDSSIYISTMSNAPDQIVVNEQGPIQYSRQTYDSDKSAWHQGIADIVNMMTPTRTRDEIAQDFAASMRADSAQSETQDTVQKAFDRMKASGLDSMDMVGAINQALQDVGSDVRVSARSDQPESFTILYPEKRDTTSETFQDHNHSNSRTSLDEMPNLSTDDLTDELNPFDPATLAQYAQTSEQADGLQLADNELMQDTSIDVSALLSDLPAFNFEQSADTFDYDSNLLFADNQYLQDFSFSDDAFSMPTFDFGDYGGFNFFDSSAGALADWSNSWDNYSFGDWSSYGAGFGDGNLSYDVYG